MLLPRLIRHAHIFRKRSNAKGNGMIHRHHPLRTCFLWQFWGRGLCESRPRDKSKFVSSEITALTTDISMIERSCRHFHQNFPLLQRRKWPVLQYSIGIRRYARRGRFLKRDSFGRGRSLCSHWWLFCVPTGWWLSLSRTPVKKAGWTGQRMTIAPTDHPEVCYISATNPI
jgi:hypothetical protein